MRPLPARRYELAEWRHANVAVRELDVIPDSLIGILSPPNEKATGRTAERLHFNTAQAGAILAFLRVLEVRERIDSGLPDDALEFAPVTRPLARAIRYWTDRAISPQ